MIRSILKGQRGGVAIITSLGFLLFSIPLLSGSLGLAQTTSIDSRVKTDTMHQKYCGLAVKEYIDYLLADTTRWDDFLANNVDPVDPTRATASVQACGEDITLTVTQEEIADLSEPLDAPLPSIPDAAAYNQRDFQTTKTVSNSNPNGGDPVTYTITARNRADTATTLTQIIDILPAGFTYDCSATAQLTLPGMAAQDVVPSNGSGCPSGSEVDWDMPSGTSIEPNDVVTITFTAVTIDNPGTYCNEAHVVPGQAKTSSGQTAVVAIDGPAGQCPGEAVLVSQTLDYADLVATDLTTIPYTYTLEIGYTIKVDNIGTTDLDLTGFIDLLPPGFSYLSTDPLGSIPDAPFKLKYNPTLDRQEVTWKFAPSIPMAPGTSQTLIFTASAVDGQGVYWVDLLVDFGATQFPEKVYSWPAALVAVKDIYKVAAVDEDGNTIVYDMQVVVQGPSGIISSWNISG